MSTAIAYVLYGLVVVGFCWIVFMLVWDHFDQKRLDREIAARRRFDEAFGGRR